MRATKDLILDKNINETIEDYLTKGEEILWEDMPMGKSSITILEMGNKWDTAAGGMMNSLGTVLAFGFFIGSYFYYESNWIGVVLTTIVSLAILIVPDVAKNIRRKETKYYISNRRVYFKLWRWWKESIEFINLEDITKINSEELPDKSGTIYFYTEKSIEINTYDFKSGIRRFLPTYEQVPNVNEVVDRIVSLRSERRMELR